MKHFLSSMLVTCFRFAYKRLGWRLTDQAIGKWGDRYEVLQCLQVRMRDCRILFLDLRNPVSVPYLLEGDFPPEQAEKQLVESIVTVDDTAVDIGANVGWYASLFCAHVGPGGVVYAFEPNPHLSPLLKRLAEQWPQLTVYEAALSAENGTAQFNIAENWISGSLASAPTSDTTHEVDLMRLDDAIKEQDVDFIKLDAEGAEIDVLKGAERYLNSPAAPIWLVELSSAEAAQFGRHPSEIIDAFTAASQAGYNAYAINQEKPFLRPLELPDQEPFWMNALFVPENRQDRIRSEWLSA